MPDRYSADEARRIFARAARRQHAAPAADGLSLEDLAEIGREAGLDPALVAAEAAAERLGDGHRATWHGVPVGVRRARLLPERVSDREWERVVDLLRAEFKMEGTAQQIGTRREWATGASASSSATTTSAYKVRVEARPDGDLVTVEAPNTHQLMGYTLGGTMASIALVFLVVGLLLDPAKLAGMAAGVAGILALAAGMYGTAGLSAKASAARTPDRFEALLDRIDLASRAEPPASRPASAPGRIDASLLDASPLDAGGPVPAGLEAPRPRTRA